jgi:hypothetical protein
MVAYVLFLKGLLGFGGNWSSLHGLKVVAVSDSVESHPVKLKVSEA